VPAANWMMYVPQGSLIPTTVWALEAAVAYAFCKLAVSIAALFVGARGNTDMVVSCY
jgi:hypothetical protein